MALRLLRETISAQAGSGPASATGEGIIESYAHAGGKIAAMVEIGCETDSRGRNDNFRRVRALGWPSRSPPGATCGSCPRTRLPSDGFSSGELEIFRAKAAAEGKPEKMLDHIFEGM